MERKPHMKGICVTTLLLAMGMAASPTQGASARLKLQVVTPDANGALHSVEGVIVEPFVAGQSKGQYSVTGTDGTASLWVASGARHELRLRKNGHASRSLAVTYQPNGDYFEARPTDGSAPAEKFAAGVFYMAKLLPAQGGPPKPPASQPAAQLTVRVRRLAAPDPKPPIAGAEVTVSRLGLLTARGFTNARGDFTTPIAVGTYDVRVMKGGYVTSGGSVTVGPRGLGTTYVLREDPKGVVAQRAELTVLVRQPPVLEPVRNAKVEIRLVGSQAAWGGGGLWTDGDGKVRYKSVETGRYEVRVAKTGFTTATVTVTVTERGAKRLVVLQPAGP